MLRELWYPTGLKIDWDRFEQAVPNANKYLLYSIIDRLQPVKDDCGGAFSPLEFGGAFMHYIDFLIQEGVMEENLFGQSYTVTVAYKNGLYETHTFQQTLVDETDAIIDKAELLSGKIYIGNLRHDDEDSIPW